MSPAQPHDRRPDGAGKRAQGASGSSGRRQAKQRGRGSHTDDRRRDRRQGATRGDLSERPREERTPKRAVSPARDAGGAHYDAAEVPRDVLAELHALARPEKGSILVKVFSEAAGAFAAGDFVEAARLGEQAKHIALRSPSARELLGLAYYRSKRWREAARELSAFRRLSGTEEQTPVLADCYRALGRPERAVELCDAIEESRVAPNVFFEGQIVAAGALRDQGQHDAAIRRLQVLDLDPPTVQEHHLRAWYMLGDLLENRGRFSRARELFEAVAATDPDATDAPERARRLARRAR